MWCNVVNAKIIKLQRCYNPSTMSGFEGVNYEKYEFAIDTNKEILSEIIVLTKKKFERVKKQKNSGYDGKINISNYKIIFADENYIKSIDYSKDKTNWSEFTVDLKKQEVHWTNSVLENMNYSLKCEKA